MVPIKSCFSSYILFASSNFDLAWYGPPLLRLLREYVVLFFLLASDCAKRSSLASWSVISKCFPENIAIIGTARVED